MKGELPRVLALDDDEIWLEQVPVILEGECNVECLPSIDQGLQAIEKEFFDIVLLDLNFDHDTRSGLDIFRKIHARDHSTDVIVISGETHPQRLIEVFNAGVTQFLSKPASPEAIRRAVRETIDRRTVRQRALGLLTAGGRDFPNPLAGIAPATLRAQQELAHVLSSEVQDLLIQGETGTGKELLARFVAKRRDPAGRFLPIHCGAINDGLVESELFGHVRGAFTGADRDRLGAFEAAGGGFVFLDEIGEMPIGQQAKILRVIQERVVQRVGSFEEKKVSFRTISATHVNLEQAVESGKFREDLYYRLAKARIELPPLRERLEDIPGLVATFLAEGPAARRKDIAPEALSLLQAYHWPGNVRQLRAVIENVQARTDERVLREKHICAALPEVAANARRVSVGSYSLSLISGERRRFERAIIQANGNRDVAAKLLGLSRATYFRRAKELGLVTARRKATAASGSSAFETQT